MNMTDPIADMITRIRNGVRARLPKIDVPASRLKVEIARILKDEGYIANFRVVERRRRQGAIRDLPEVRPRLGARHHRPAAGEPPRLPHLLRQGRDPARLRRARHQHPVHLARRHDRPRGREDRRGRRDPLQRLVRSPRCLGSDARSSSCPSGVKVSVEETALEVQGPKGKLTTPVPPGISFALVGHGAQLPALERRAPAARLPRAGAGPRAERDQGRDRGLLEGPRHRRRRLPRRGRGRTRSCSPSATRTRSSYPIPEGIKIAVDKQTRVTVSGIDRQKVGPGGRRDPQPAQAGPLQAEGHPVRGRGPQEEGRQGRRHGAK